MLIPHSRSAHAATLPSLEYIEFLVVEFGYYRHDDRYQYHDDDQIDDGESTINNLILHHLTYTDW